MRKRMNNGTIITKPSYTPDSQIPKDENGDPIKGADKTALGTVNVSPSGKRTVGIIHPLLLDGFIPSQGLLAHDSAEDRFHKMLLTEEMIAAIKEDEIVAGEELYVELDLAASVTQKIPYAMVLTETGRGDISDADRKKVRKEKTEKNRAAREKKVREEVRSLLADNFSVDEVLENMGITEEQFERAINHTDDDEAIAAK